MKAAVYHKFGSPDVLQLEEREKPVPQGDEVLVRVHAASLNYGDMALVRGKPFLIRLMGYGFLKPKYETPGTDIAGTVEAIGPRASLFQPGDAVFGDISECGFGALAEYVCVPEKALTLKPSNMTFDEAAAVPQAAVVALQGLRDHGQIQAGQNVLINGASGGVGTFAVQIAKALGAEVTGVCSTGNVELVRSIGADRVIDYTQEDFTRGEQHYDLILDIVANRPTSDYMSVLNPGGKYVAVAFNPAVLFMGSLLSRGDKRASALNHKPRVEDQVFMKELLEAGKVTPVIDRRYPLSEVAQALRHVEGSHRGKTIITMAGDGAAEGAGTHG